MTTFNFGNRDSEFKFNQIDRLEADLEWKLKEEKREAIRHAVLVARTILEELARK